MRRRRGHTQGWKALVLVGAALGSISPVAAQDLKARRDSTTGNWYVTVFDDDLRPREVLVEAADRVVFHVRATVEAEGSLFRYRYLVRVDPASPQGLRTFQVDCPLAPGRVTELVAGTTLEGRPRELVPDLEAWAGHPSCLARLGAAPLTAGATMELSFLSPLLPMPGEVRGIGAVAGMSWPTSDPIAENDAARELVQRVQGLTGGWRSMPGLVPGRARTALGDPARGVAVLREDLALACGSLGWISDASVCRALGAALDELARGARGALARFSETLAAHRPALADDAAFTLLSVTAAVLAAPR